MSKKNSIKEVSEKLISLAKSYGAEDADVLCVKNKQISANVRLGKTESIESSESESFSLRVFIGHKSSIVSSSNNDRLNTEHLVSRAVDMAKISPEDPYLSLADKSLYPERIPDLNLYDNSEVELQELIDTATETENYALEVNGITNSEGSSSSYSTSSVLLTNTNNFCKEYKTSMYGISCCVLAKGKYSMERDYEYCYSRHKSDLKTPLYIGEQASERTLKRLNAKKANTGKMPVVYDPRSASEILSVFASAINGELVSLEKSFLKDQMGKKIFSDSVNIINDPLIQKGLSSKPFDCEAVEKSKMFVVKNGKLKNWFLDNHSSKKLGLTSNGCAARTLSAHPYPSCDNLYIENSNTTKEELLSGIKKGIYITQNFGRGINLLTGDYSQGCAGFMIENGKITFPVHEFTVSGNLKDMFAGALVANDLEYKYSINTPTLYIENITVSGK